MAMTLRLTPEQEEMLAMLAKADGVSRQEAVIRALNDAATRKLHQQRVRESSAAGRARYQDLLERLGR